MDAFKTDRLLIVTGLVVVIPGGGSGLGEMMALALDTNGADPVFILERRMASLQDVTKKAMNEIVVPVQCDISSKQSLQDAVAWIKRQTQFVNMLIANSGIIGLVTSLPPRAADASIASIQQHFWETPHDESNQLMNVNADNSTPCSGRGL